MKLIHCPICGDVFRLIDTHWRKCECGQCGGQYNKDLMTATIDGKKDVGFVVVPANPIPSFKLKRPRKMWAELTTHQKTQLRRAAQAVHKNKEKK